METNAGKKFVVMTGFKVAVVGPSGAGKTTAALKISSRKSEVHWVEVSRDLIERRQYEDTGNFTLDRQKGFDHCLKMRRLRGPDWAAKLVTLNYAHARNTLVTGIRGLDNVCSLKAAGFFCIFLTASKDVLSKRLASRQRIEQDIAFEHLDRESRCYEFDATQLLCDLTLDTTEMTLAAVEAALVNVCISVSEKVRIQTETNLCSCCVNSRYNISAFANGKQICDTCESFRNAGERSDDIDALDRILAECNGDSKRPVLLGYSGGKDSHVAALRLMSQVKSLRLFTIDTGYYPISMLDRAMRKSKQLGLEHDTVDARKQMTLSLRASYDLTAELFEKLNEGRGGASRSSLYEIYANSRHHYSAKDNTIQAFPRVCVLCRKLVIRAYYDHARRIGAKYMFLGLNEWASLSSSAGGPHATATYSGIRTIDPYMNGEELTIVHLPYVLNASLTDNSSTLHEAGWNLPFGERLVETNGNSCLLAKITEWSFFQSLLFHPDSTRLGREVTVGFLRRGDALDALSTISRSPWSARELLQYAGILG